jgi:ATP-dependent Lon protease
VLHLTRFYPDESTLIGILMSSPSDFDEIAYDYPDQVHRLHQLGVIEPVGSGWAASRVLQMGWELANRMAPIEVRAEAEPGRVATAEASAVIGLNGSELIERGESANVEFKQTAIYNIHTNAKDSRIELAVIKTVAGFLNAKGGVVLIGVRDDGCPVGLEPDFGVCSQRKDRDGFENWLYTRLLDQIDGAAIASCVTLSFEKIGSHEICRLDVMPCSRPVYMGDGALFFVRIGNSTRQYNTRDAQSYIRAHWYAEKS